MHIPDGYLSPKTVISSYVVTLPLLIYALKRLKHKLNEKTLPIIGALSGLSFIIMMFNIPIPGGTSGHAVGATIISLIFDPWIASISVSLVLFIQAIIFGDGGISTFAVNALSMGFIASFSGYYTFQLFKNKKFAPFLAGWVSLVLASLSVAIFLGIQPMIWIENGKALYFPYDLKTTIPALVGSHALFFGIVEGIFTMIIYSYINKERNIALKEKSELKAEEDDKLLDSKEA